MSYKELKSCQQAAIVHDFTFEFCECYMTYKTNKSYRTYDQMIQAARSGKQNIAEASANPTSEKSELKLLGVARASFQELLEDYEDFLRQRDFRLWPKDSAEARAVRDLAYRTYKSYRTYRSYLNNPESAANCAICLINQANFLLDRQIAACEKEFVSKGGYTENLSRRRNEELKKKFIGIEFRKHE